MTVAKEVALFLDGLGVFDIVLPFILVFSVAYGSLDRAQVLGKGEEGKRYNIVVSLVLALIVVGSLYITGIITSLVQYAAFIIVILVFIAVLGKFIGGMDDAHKGQLPKYLVLIVIAVVALYALAARSWLQFSFLSSTLVPVIIIFALMFLLIYWVVSADDDSDGRKDAPKGKSSSSSDSPVGDFDYTVPSPLPPGLSHKPDPGKYSLRHKERIDVPRGKGRLHPKK